MTLDLDGHVCIVLGSSRGIGRGIALALLSEGARVVLTGRDRESLDATLQECLAQYPDQVVAFCGDLQERATLERIEQAAAGRWGAIHALVASAGAVRSVNDWQIEPEDWNWYFESNFWLSVRAVTFFVPRLSATRGSILFISSIAGIEEVGAPLPYAAAKAALTMYSKGLSRRLAPLGIRVNTIAPGNVLFPGGNWERRQQSDPDGVARLIADRVPLRTFGEPDDIGALAAFLLSPRARFITGCCAVADGGQTSRL